MSPEFIEQAVAAVVALYGSDEVRRAKDGARTLVRIGAVEMPPGCKPEVSPMMLVFDPSQPKPIPYVQPGQLLANGKVPTSTSATLVGGESWMQYSFNIPWDESKGIVRFITAARQRFAQDA